MAWLGAKASDWGPGPKRWATVAMKSRTCAPTWLCRRRGVSWTTATWNSGRRARSQLGLFGGCRSIDKVSFKLALQAKIASGKKL